MVSERIPSPARPWIGWTLFVLVVLFILAGWLVVRGMGAGEALRNAAKSADNLRIAIIDGSQSKIEIHAQRVLTQASSAQSLTADPVWRAAEWLPWLGSGMKELRELSEASDALASAAIPALLDATKDVNIATFGIAKDQIPLTGLSQAQRSIAQIGRAAAQAGEVLDAIDVDTVGGPARDGVLSAHEGLTDAVRKLSAMSAAAELLPAMLGTSEPRTYLLVTYNPNQLRNAGGAIETVTRVTTGPDAIQLDRTTSARSIANLETPAIEVDPRMLALLPEAAVTRFREASAIPDFPTQARVLAAHWLAVNDETVDGVIAIDPVTLQRVLAVIGEVHTTDRTFTSHGIVEFLTTKLPLEGGTVSDQITVFATAVGTALGDALDSSRTAALIAALYDAGEDGHLRLWSAHEGEQARLVASDIGGAFPSDGTRPIVGVFANDLTGARLDAYTSAEITVAYGECAGTPTTRFTVVWSNSFEIDADAETAPSAALLGPASEEYEPGAVRTNISVYGPEGARASGLSFAGRTVVQREVTVEPGGSATVTVDFTGTGAGVRPEVRHGFLLNEPEITVTPVLECG